MAVTVWSAHAQTRQSQHGYQAIREVLELKEDANFFSDETGKIQPCMISPVPLIHKNIRR